MLEMSLIQTSLGWLAVAVGSDGYSAMSFIPVPDDWTYEQVAQWVAEDVTRAAGHPIETTIVA
jgi:hypothetical protein